jgi:hypothetical protein
VLNTDCRSIFEDACDCVVQREIGRYLQEKRGGRRRGWVVVFSRQTGGMRGLWWLMEGQIAAWGMAVASTRKSKPLQREEARWAAGILIGPTIIRPAGLCRPSSDRLLRPVKLTSRLSAKMWVPSPLTRLKEGMRQCRVSSDRVHLAWQAIPGHIPQQPSSERRGKELSKRIDEDDPLLPNRTRISCPINISGGTRPEQPRRSWTTHPSRPQSSDRHDPQVKVAAPSPLQQLAPHQAQPRLTTPSSQHPPHSPSFRHSRAPGLPYGPARMVAVSTVTLPFGWADLERHHVLESGGAQVRG